MRTLPQWIDYIQTLHHRQIDLTLERVRQVYQRLIVGEQPFTVITIAGTNGKGSTAELIASIYLQTEYRVGKFTSPHLIRFNERYMINGQMVNDADLLSAFERIEQARGDIPITFFEYSTLLAIELFRAAGVQIAVMEVGLGGRQDAVNILNPDIAIITSIAIDHTAWLGDNVDDIAYEKVGVARAHTPCLVGDTQPSQRILDYCAEIAAHCQVQGQDFSYQTSAEQDTWSWRNQRTHYTNLPLPFGQTGVQLSNASLAIQAVDLLQTQHAVSAAQVLQGIAQASVEARCQVISEQPLVVLDVAHNVSSVARLVDFISRNAPVKVVCGMLSDKEIEACLALLVPLASEWYFANIEHERAASAQELATIVRGLDATAQLHCYQDARTAYSQAMQNVKNTDTLLVFGSFFIAGDILAHLNEPQIID